jgi:hypothetical protein
MITISATGARSVDARPSNPALRRAAAWVLAGLALVVTVPARAWVVDQAHTPEIFGSWSVAGMGPVGQEFVPALSPLNVVELWINHGYSGTEQPADLFVRVREGAIDGTILGESAAVRVEDGLFAAVRFDFATPIPLTAGNTYVIEARVVPGGGNPMVCGADAPGYAAGRIILLGNPVAGDLWFRTGATEDVGDEAASWGAVKALFRRAD